MNIDKTSLEKIKQDALSKLEDAQKAFISANPKHVSSLKYKLKKEKIETQDLKHLNKINLKKV